MNRVSIVLAHLMSEKGELNAETAARVDMAVEIEKHLDSTLVLLCGWPYRPDCDLAIADAMKEYLLVTHPRFSQTLKCQRFSRDTVGDAVFSRLFIESLIGSPDTYLVNIVTSDYHVNRAREIFEFVFTEACPISIVGVPGFATDESAAKEAQSLLAFRKTLSKALSGDLDSVLASLRTSHPFYNGEVYPRIGSLSDIMQALMKNPD